MAIRDNISNLLTTNAFYAASSSSQLLEGAVIDTANNEMGLAIVATMVEQSGPLGNARVWLAESDNASGPFTDVADEAPGAEKSPKVIGDANAIQFTSEETAEGSLSKKLGYISTKRYVRVRVLTTASGGGFVRLNVIILQSGEECPVEAALII